MFKQDILHVLTREGVVGFKGKRIDRNFLIENIADFSQHFYVCGPSDFVEDILAGSIIGSFTANYTWLFLNPRLSKLNGSILNRIKKKN